MLEWVSSWPDWLQAVWFGYITFHDFVQWGIMLILAKTAWGQRKEKRDAEKLIEHIHCELHTHILEDASFHEDLGQGGMSGGE